MESKALIPHLFRTEYRKIIAVVGRFFGFSQMELAEDIVSETFLAAAQVWGMNGVPENPSAWLYAVAKNKAKNYLQRNSVFRSKIAPELRRNQVYSTDEGFDLSEENIRDSQLKMMFAICHPSISEEAQIGLSLRILCGFGIEEIADAFLSNKETINKRLFRAKQKLKEEKISIELPKPSEIELRLETVLKTIYLLFSEGYYSVSNNDALRKELCYEAMRLCYMLIENNITNKPHVNALFSLMCFHSSRFDARIGNNGEVILYDEQDTRLWNTELIEQGIYFFNCSAKGDTLSKYHLEAGIAYWYSMTEDVPKKWENILHLHNLLLQVEYSPLAALNRTYALSKIHGKDVAIAAAEKLKLIHNHFYFVLLGELYEGIDDKKAKDLFVTALSLAKTEADRNIIRRKIDKHSQVRLAETESFCPPKGSEGFDK